MELHSSITAQMHRASFFVQARQECLADIKGGLLPLNPKVDEETSSRAKPEWLEDKEKGCAAEEEPGRGKCYMQRRAVRLRMPVQRHVGVDVC